MQQELIQQVALLRARAVLPGLTILTVVLVVVRPVQLVTTPLPRDLRHVYLVPLVNISHPRE